MAGAVNPVLGALAVGMQSTGRTAQDAYHSNGKDLKQAILAGQKQGLIDGGVELGFAAMPWLAKFVPDEWFPNAARLIGGASDEVDDVSEAVRHGDKTPVSYNIEGVELTSKDGYNNANKNLNSKLNVTNTKKVFTQIDDESLVIHAGKQEKHIVGSNNYIVGRSVFDGTVEDAQRLLKEFSGTGERITENKERVDFGVVIGQYADVKTGKLQDTTVGIIHYSKTGTHIVPAKP